MLFVTEDEARSLLSLPAAIESVEEGFVQLDEGSAQALPVVGAAGLQDGQRWGVKSGRNLKTATLGCKLGSYWSGNPARGLPAHGSTVLLLDPATGFVSAVVQAAHLTALRTAAADAIAVRQLARRNASTLTILGAGHQAFFDLRAIALMRSLERVLIWSRTAAHAERFATRGRAEGYPCEVSTLRAAVESADIITTVTAATGPLFDAAWVRPGTHVSAMGADARGKQELPVSLVAHGRLFADVVEQSITIGEFQSAHHAGTCDPADIRTLGSLLRGLEPGRTSDDEITIFDSSGTAIQDLAVCAAVVRAAPGR